MKIKVEGINKNYQHNEVLKDISFYVREGEFLTILGASGSGKSTILRVLTGLTKPTKGCIFLEGKDITHTRTEERGIAYVFQSPLLFPHLTVRENIAFGLKVKKIKPKEINEEVDKLLKLLKIEDLAERFPSQISGGQQQRVSIARALATKPSLILMDEPFSGLDMALRNEMGLLIKELQKLLGLTIIFVTHDLNESLRLSDKILLIDQGKVLQFGDTKLVYYQPKTKEISLFMGGGNWVDGEIQDEVFRCSFGEFRAENMQNGKASLFFRLHQLAVSKDLEELKFKVNNITSLGKELQVEVAYQEESLVIETFKDRSLKLGDEVSIRFPKTNLHYILL